LIPKASRRFRDVGKGRQKWGKTATIFSNKQKKPEADKSLLALYSVKPSGYFS